MTRNAALAAVTADYNRWSKLSRAEIIDLVDWSRRFISDDECGTRQMLFMALRDAHGDQAVNDAQEARLLG